jgi:hypothetical protein
MQFPEDPFFHAATNPTTGVEDQANHALARWHTAPI